MTTFDASGSGHDLTLVEAKALAATCGFNGSLDALFQAYGCRALSPFRKKFKEEKLAPPPDGFVSPPRSVSPTRATTPKASLEPEPPLTGLEPLPGKHFEAAVATWEKGLKWRLVKRPGGAYINPDDWYRLYAGQQQAKEGDNTRADRPVWADHGGIDFHGGAAWDAWDTLKGLAKDKAVAEFCRYYAEAHHPSRVPGNFHNVPPPNPWLSGK